MDTVAKFGTSFPRKLERAFKLRLDSSWLSLRNHPKYALPIGKCNFFFGQTFDTISGKKGVK